MEGLQLAVMAAANIICFLIGAKVGQTVHRGGEIKLLNVNPMEAVREQKAKRDAGWEQSRIDTILRNVENYDGTEYGQEDVPGR